MSRDASSRAQDASRQDVAMSNSYGAQANKLQSQLASAYGQEYANPTGMGAADMAAARTAANQGTGGAVASAVGQGNLEAARTGNSGGYQYQLEDAARKGIQQASQNALNVQNENTALKQAQKAQGLSGLQGLESGDVSAQLGAEGLNNGAINADTNASPGWFQNMTGLISSLTGASKGPASYI